MWTNVTTELSQFTLVLNREVSYLGPIAVKFYQIVHVGNSVAQFGHGVTVANELLHRCAARKTGDGTQRGTRCAIEMGERGVACHVETREFVVPAFERSQSCTAMTIKSGQTAVLAINRRQPWIVVAVQASQRALAADIKRGNLVVAGEECSERIQATNVA